MVFTQEGFDFYMLRNEIIQEVDVEEEVTSTSGLATTKVIKFDSNTDPIPLSKEECSFLIDNVISKFPLELEIIRKVLLRLDDTGKLGTRNIDTEIEIAVRDWEKKAKSDPKMTTVTVIPKTAILRTRLVLTTRIATMGRLTELDVVEWEMERGRSSYTKGKNFDMCMKSIKKK